MIKSGFNEYKFGIIMPTYNRPKLLQRAIHSVINSNYKNWLLVVVDDGSQTKKENEMVVKTFDEDRIIYKALDRNYGVNRARNEALEILLQTDCDFITFIDDDDLLLTGSLSNINKIINDFPNIEWYFFKAIAPDGHEITNILDYTPSNYLSYLMSNNISGDAVHVLKKELLYNVRFSMKIKNGKELVFFGSIKSKIYPFDLSVIIREYFNKGLTLSEVTQKDQERPWKKLMYKKVSEIIVWFLKLIFPPFIASKIVVKTYEQVYFLVNWFRK